MAATQTLFSFELFVEKVRFGAAGRVKAEKGKPAVGVRLLDFPTLLIYRSEKHRPDPKHEPGGLSESSGDSFCFNRGKSCLFKISLDSLHSQLCSAPLYIMVLDVNSEIPKLLGSSLISLSTLTGSIKLAVEKHGIWTPAARGEKFRSRILNLMGETIGTISVSCKIVSLGASVIPHVSESEACGAPPEPNNTKCAPAEGNVNSGTDEVQPPCADSYTGDVSPATVKPSGTKTLHAATQTEHLRQKDATSVDIQVKSDELCGTFCPPPLFYSASRANRQQSACYGMKDLEEHLRMVDLHTEDTDDGSESSQMESAPQKPMRAKEDGSPTNLGQQQSQTVPPVLTDAVRQLPLLNALLAELSHLSTQMQQPLSGHPVQFISAQESSPSSGKPQTESLKPGCRQGNLPGRVSPLISPAVRKSHRESSRPERKLRYGLTHSFRLRLKQIKPGTTRHRECTEELKTRKRSPKPKPDHSQTFNAYLDASGETLPNRSHSQRSPAPGKQTKPPAVKDVPDKADKEVQVRVPSALGQNIDHKAYDSVSNSQPHVIQTSPDFRSSVQSDGNPSSPSHSSFSRHDSPQPDDYQDDFTSLDPTDASPDPLSSPEPYRPPRTRVSSGNVSSDSSSQRNKPHPIPVKAETSPKRSLRATHTIRPHLQNFARSTSSDDSKSGFSRTSVQRKSESHGSSLRSPTASRIFGTPVGERSQHSDDSMLESVSSTDSEEERDELGSLSFQNKYRPISELVVNKLPGYTL